MWPWVWEEWLRVWEVTLRVWGGVNHTASSVWCPLPTHIPYVA